MAHGQAQRLIWAKHDLGDQLLPGRVLNSFYLGDNVISLQTNFRRGGILLHPADNRGLVHVGGVFVVHHVNNGQQADRQHDVHERPGNGNQKAVPARMRQKFPRIAGALIHGILAAHLHIAAQRQQIDAVVRLAFLKANQAGAKSNGKLLHANAQQLGHGKVAELVDQNHESKNDGNGYDINENSRHKFL